MSSTGAHPHCQPCENLKHWIEIIVRDEHNQPFEGVSGVLIDAMKNKHPIELNASPILIENLAPGPVEIELGYDQWLKAAQDKSHPRNEEKAKPVEEFSSSYSAHKSGPVVYQEITTGDLTKLPKEVVLPTNHQKGKAGTLKLFTDKTYILQVRAYKFITLRIGMFFDGTANNTYSAQWGKQQLENYYRKWKAKYDTECEINSKNGNGTKKEVPITALSNDCFTYPKKDNFILSLFKNDEGEMETVAGSASNELTNVQKLFDLYSQDKFFKEKNMFSHAEYITGIGTGNSTAIAPADESIVVGQGLGIGKYGVTAKVTTGIQTLSQNIEQVTSTFEKVLEMKVDGIEKLQFDVFGFSRGAAAARHFINMVLDGENGEFAKTFTLGCQKADLPLIYAFDWGEVDEIKANCEITFAGLFDTVASVVNIFSKNSPLGLDLNTHTDNGDVRLWIDPKRVRHAVHLTADPTIECRDNFSLNHLNSTDEEHFHEFVLPGAHSDIGGGYHSRLSFDNPDYLLPVLEKKLVKRVSRTFSDRWDEEKTKQYVLNELEKYKVRDRLTGWKEEDYVIEPLEIRQEGKNDGGRVIGKLYIQRQVEGDLSRLYLRLMYGLAEFHGVPISDNNAKLWQDSERVDYNVGDYGGLFADLNQKVLEFAKQGKYSALQQKLSIPELKTSLMALNLFHHSSGDDIGMSPLWDKKAGCYKRASYQCKQGK
ncbi:DUF2235 domain-containing protein [Vibrio cholerae]|uniref:phospholipase effector Tle1 domain-containing protein n=1 Tax=Vibrio cholerae TaxID=666 RepID=UPI0011D8AF7E|nr:DUF2235 domain-containing protein [Vibrio cholerae]EJL6484750.1 DUF2235 domain-containing protein [Vibrio cholerae]MCX9469046.1 DUF2235 domain-containing protein [Vibrio cholerae]TXZ85231.1 DUF2235 domain-containing protein [Vibrio cholerae]GHY15656.1 VgrG protein [Vibrio cholerae]